MPKLDLASLRDKYDDEYLEFQRVEKKRTNRPDLHAFMLLDELFPAEEESDMLSGRDCDQIFLDVDLDELAEKATEEQIVELLRCGVSWDEESIYVFA
jgi:hypothetical protein